jgi:biopolymer transport protein ExbD
MRDRTSRPAEQGKAIDLTPMLDVVFIMLIFFIVTASFIKTPGQDVNKPIGATQDPISASVLVAVTENGDIYIDKRKVAENEVKITIARLHAENPNGALVIQADAKTTLKQFSFVADAAKMAGVERITIATLKE